MLFRELETDEPGGILADEMGLGKTMQTIALLRANPLKTLIVTTIPTMSQWQHALYDFGGFRPIVVSSSYKGILPEEGVEVVVTGYSSFQLPAGKGPECLKDYPFERIILDEGHSIRNPKTRLFKELSELHGRCRWILSGTPIQNSTKDMLALASWIGIRSATTVEDICNEFMLRRTQEGEASTNPRLALPKLTTEVKRLAFKYPEERKLYKRVERYFERQLAEVASSQRYTTAIEGITRCRQVCTHPQLYIDGLKRKKDNAAKKRKPLTIKKRAFKAPKAADTSSAGAGAVNDDDAGAESTSSDTDTDSDDGEIPCPETSGRSTKVGDASAPRVVCRLAPDAEHRERVARTSAQPPPGA